MTTAERKVPPSGATGFIGQRLCNRGKGVPLKMNGRGLLAEALGERLPLLPMEIESYRRGLAPSTEPITLIRHPVRRLGSDFLAGPIDLEPNPKDLTLRHHV